jgi:hypothetical protein
MSCGGLKVMSWNGKTLDRVNVKMILHYRFRLDEDQVRG